MTRDGTVGRFRRNRAKPGVSSGHRSRLNDEDSVRAPHQGQQSTRTAPTGRTHDCKRPLCCTPNDLLPGRGHPHMNVSSDSKRDPAAKQSGEVPALGTPARPDIATLHRTKTRQVIRSGAHERAWSSFTRWEAFGIADANG